MRSFVKISSSLVLGALLLGLAAVPASAQTYCRIERNGAFSTNTCTQVNVRANITAKFQQANIANIAVPVAVSGLNIVAANVGETIITSGSSTSTVNINNTFNQ